METKGTVNSLYLQFNNTARLNGDFDVKRLALDIDNAASPTFKVELIEELFRLDPILREETQSIKVDVIASDFGKAIFPEVEKAAKEFVRLFLNKRGSE